MKKKIVLVIVSLVLGFTTPVAHAFSLSDLFPPLEMQSDSTYGNPPATDVNQIGAQGVSNNTYINKLQADEFTCHSYVEVKNDWSANTREVTDQNGDTHKEFIYPYKAKDMTGKADYNDLSNNYNRFIGAFINRGLPAKTPEEEAANFKDMNVGGYGTYSKIYGIDQKHCLQGQAVEEIIKSFDEQDTNYSDIQLGWERGGQFIDMLDSTCSPLTCRPVTVGEVVYFYSQLTTDKYEKDPLLYSDCSTMTSKVIPSFDYPTIYKKRFNKNLVLFPDENTYFNLRDKIIIKALGPIRQKVVLSNYGTILSPEPNLQVGDEIKVPKIRLIPFGAAGNPKLSNQLSSVTSPRDFATAFTCDNFAVNGGVALDKPNSLSFEAFVHGLVKLVTDQPTFQDHFNNPLAVQIENKTIQAPTEITNDFANIIPAGPILEKIQKTPPSSKVTEDSPIDPGNQAEKANYYVAKYLYPQSWQDIYKF